MIYKLIDYLKSWFPEEKEITPEEIKKELKKRGRPKKNAPKKVTKKS
jgi:hypothetical protein|tara:strand:+ start:1215 stop:1355 length:141 start_codon:yes stop_codon:yes gene_type:complete